MSFSKHTGHYSPWFTQSQRDCLDVQIMVYKKMITKNQPSLISQGPLTLKNFEVLKEPISEYREEQQLSFTTKNCNRIQADDTVWFPSYVQREAMDLTRSFHLSLLNVSKVSPLVPISTIVSPELIFAPSKIVCHKLSMELSGRDDIEKVKNDQRIYYIPVRRYFGTNQNKSVFFYEYNYSCLNPLNLCKSIPLAPNLKNYASLTDYGNLSSSSSCINIVEMDNYLPLFNMAKKFMTMPPSFPFEPMLRVCTNYSKSSDQKRKEYKIFKKHFTKFLINEIESSQKVSFLRQCRGNCQSVSGNDNFCPKYCCPKINTHSGEKKSSSTVEEISEVNSSYPDDINNSKQVLIPEHIEGSNSNVSVNSTIFYSKEVPIYAIYAYTDTIPSPKFQIPEIIPMRSLDTPLDVDKFINEYIDIRKSMESMDESSDLNTSVSVNHISSSLCQIQETSSIFKEAFSQDIQIYQETTIKSCENTSVEDESIRIELVQPQSAQLLVKCAALELNDGEKQQPQNHEEGLKDSNPTVVTNGQHLRKRKPNNFLGHEVLENEMKPVNEHNENEYEIISTSLDKSLDAADSKKYPRRKGIKSLSRDSVRNTKMKNIMDIVIAATDKTGAVLSELFMKLPSREDYPPYYEIIKEPMDIEQILSNISDGKYTRMQYFERDFKLMYLNAIHFNEEDSYISVYASTLYSVFTETIKNLRETEKYERDMKKMKTEEPKAKIRVKSKLDQMQGRKDRALRRMTEKTTWP